MASSNHSDNYYALLNIPHTATQDEVRRAYRKEALVWHPDKPTGDAARFKSINEAYQVLSSPSSRSRYDTALNNAQYSRRYPQDPRTPLYDPLLFDPMAHFQFAFRNADDVFRSVFGGDLSTMSGLSDFLPFGHHSMPLIYTSSSAGLGSFPPLHSTMMSQSSVFPSTSFSSISTTRSVDSEGNVVEESITVDSTGKRTVKRVVNGVSNLMSQSYSHPQPVNYRHASLRAHYTTPNSPFTAPRDFCTHRQVKKNGS